MHEEVQQTNKGKRQTQSQIRILILTKQASNFFNQLLASLKTVQIQIQIFFLIKYQYHSQTKDWQMIRVKLLTQVLRVCFSNQPKNIQKPGPIDFNFKIPSKALNKNESEKDSQNSQQVKMIKAKRTVDVSKIIKRKKQGDQYKAKIEQSYQYQQQKKVVDNIKTSEYHQEQYFKGEHLIENIPLDPYHSYKLADFQRKVQLQNDKFKDFISPYTNFDLKAEAKFRIAQQYHEKQQKYEVEEFFRYIDQYPGSPNGPRPEDDIEFFVQYAYEKIPPVLAAQIAARQAQIQNSKKKVTANNINDLQAFTIPQQECFSSVLGKVRSLQPPLEKDRKHENVTQNCSKFTIFKDYQEIPQIPELQFRNYQQWMKDLTNWKNFKNYYVKKHGPQNVERDLEHLSRIYEENDPQPENEYFTPRANAPSLLRYYQTLPKQIQDHPGLKDIYLGLEYHCPYIPYEEKQQALNHACTMVLPLDKVSERAMNDFIEKKKYYLTPFMVDKIFSINPEYTWDINDFFAQIKREQLKGQSMIKQNEGSYPQPPQVHLQWEQGVANLPVDFYDNDDGFWDEIISQKLKRQDESKPIMKTRKSFYH